MRREDKYLVATRTGAAYEDYIKNVGRFVPRIRRWK